jgi:hypothetical protein
LASAFCLSVFKNQAIAVNDKTDAFSDELTRKTRVSKFKLAVLWENKWASVSDPKSRPESEANYD